MGMSRSENMRRIRSKDTVPELIVRQLLRKLRLYRLPTPQERFTREARYCLYW